ncbi:MAG: hypothetical protein ABH821_02155 [archaeon]
MGKGSSQKKVKTRQNNGFVANLHKPKPVLVNLLLDTVRKERTKIFFEEGTARVKVDLNDERQFNEIRNLLLDGKIRSYTENGVITFKFFE